MCIYENETVYKLGISTQSLLLNRWLTLSAKSLQSCPTLCNPIDGSPPGSPVHGILQARVLEWVAIFFSNAWKWKVKVKSLCRVWLLATSWTAAHQAPPSMGFSKQEYWSGVPLPSLKRSELTLKCLKLIQESWVIAGRKLKTFHSDYFENVDTKREKAR